MNPHKIGGAQWQKVVNAERAAHPSFSFSRPGNPRNQWILAAGCGAFVLAWTIFSARLYAAPYKDRKWAGPFGDVSEFRALNERVLQGKRWGFMANCSFSLRNSSTADFPLVASPRFAGSETAVEARLGGVIDPVDYVQPLVAPKHSRMSTADLPPTILK